MEKQKSKKPIGRPYKEKIDWFPFQTDFFERAHIQAVSKDFSIKGEMVALRLICEIFKHGYYIKVTDPLLIKISMYVASNKDDVYGVIGMLVDYEYFDTELFRAHDVLTNKDIQAFYRKATNSRRYVDCSKYWLLEKERPIGSFPKRKGEQVRIRI